MKKLLIILSAICLSFFAAAQVPGKINFQAVLYDAGNNIIENQMVGLQFSVFRDSASGTLVYKETHALSTNDYGLINLKVGDGNVVSGNFSGINLSEGSYFLETAIDFSGGTNYGLMGVSQLLSVPYSLRTIWAGFGEIADYDSLSNRPTVISEGQAAKLGHISITGAVNLDNIGSDIDSNLAKVVFPGFGTTAGTAYEIMWTQIADSAYYPSGNIGMGFDTSVSFTGSVLHVGGGILQRSIPSDSSGGLMYYDSTAFAVSGPGVYYYYDDSLEKQTFSAEYAVLYKMYFIDSTAVIRDIVHTNDLIIRNNFVVGSQATPGYDFKDKSAAIVDSIIRLYFWDTSSSSAFPNKDWKIQVNDAGNAGLDYFAIIDTATGLETIPFKVMAAAPDNTIIVDGNGNTGIGTNTPTARLEVTGTVTAGSLVGDANSITGLPGVGSSTQNSGSTTIGSDSDNDTNGELVFQTKNQTRLVIANNGKVGIGTPSPSEMLEVNGTLTLAGMNISNTLSPSGGSVTGGLFFDPTNATATLDYDVAGKNVVFFNSASGIVTISGFQNGIKGQKITLVNLSSTNTLKLSPFGGTQPMVFPNLNRTIPQYGTATLIFNGSLWICTDVVL